MKATFRSLRFFNYRIWFLGALVSNVGTWLQRTAQDWIVLTRLTDEDAFAVGVTLALQFGPMLLLGPFAGPIVDRIPARRLLVITQVAQAVLAIGLGVILLTDVAQLWMVYGFALLLGIVTCFDNPTRQTFVGELVPKADLPNAVALNSASFNGARLIGPAIAGIAIAAFGAGWVFLLNAATFIAVLSSIAAIRTKEMYPLARAPRGRGQLRAGIAYVRSRPDIVAVLAMVFLIGTFGLNFAIFTSTMAKIEFGKGAGEFGLLSSILAVGSLAGALSAAGRGRPRLRSIVLASAGFGIFSTVSALMPTYELFAVSLVPIGVCAMIITTSANAYVQTTTSPMLRGRVMSLYMAIFAGTTLLGAPVVGAVASAFGPRWSLGVAAAAGILAALVGAGWYAVEKDVRIRRHPQARWGFTIGADPEQRPDLVDRLFVRKHVASRSGKRPGGSTAPTPEHPSPAS